AEVEVADAARGVGVGICLKIDVLTFLVVWSFELFKAWSRGVSVHGVESGENSLSELGLNFVLTSYRVAGFGLSRPGLMN
ncbi:hypothetical protein Droror1_Dr00016542, partial [Drosera rotundifolia]